MSDQRGQRAFQVARLRKLSKKQVETYRAPFAQALATYQRGAAAEAKAMLREILQQAPQHIDALHVLGMFEYRSGAYDEADRLLSEAIAIEPSADMLCNRAAILQELKRYEEALASCERALALKPDHALAQNNRGNALGHLGRHAEALASYDRALKGKPDYPECFSNRGNTLTALGRFEDAVASYDQAIALRPDYAEALSNRGNALAALARHDEALASFERAVALRPDYAEAFNNRGNVLSELEHYEQAVESYERAIALRPEYAEALSNRAHALTQLRHYDEAIRCCEMAIALRPDYADAYSNRGNALFSLERLDEALADQEKALALKPDLAAAWLGCGNIHLAGKRYGEAFAAFNKVLDLKPQSYKALTQLAAWHGQHGNIDDVIACYDRALEIKPDFDYVISNRIFALDFVLDIDFEQQQAARRHWWRQVGARIAAAGIPDHAPSRDPERKLVLGYVSSDFRSHSAAMAFKQVLENHDKSRFEVVCYSCSTVTDAVTGEFQATADRWRNAAQLSDEALANQVLADKIDILVDLSGHTAGNRLATFARKPAPIQVTAWGHATGTGLETMDYLFSDAVVLPQEARKFFAEKIYDLPCAISLQPLPAGIGPADPPMLRNGYVTFGVYNRVSKISEMAIRVWANILTEVPDAKMLIKDQHLGDEQHRRQLCDRFAAHGVLPDRLEFRGSTPRQEHLISYKHVDICLDPFPQNGGVSTWESLQMGVPVVAQLGPSMTSRISASILTSIGMSEWVGADNDGYRAIAVAWAKMPEKLKSLRHRLPQMVSTSASGNSVAYTRAVEEGYRAMWRDYCAKAAEAISKSA